MPLKQSARIIVILFLAGTTFKAVEPGLPSKTAVYVTAARAVGAKDPDPQLRNPDYLAIKFLGPRERAVLPDLPMDALDLNSGTPSDAFRIPATSPLNWFARNDSTLP